MSVGVVEAGGDPPVPTCTQCQQPLTVVIRYQQTRLPFVLEKFGFAPLEEKVLREQYQCDCGELIVNEQHEWVEAEIQRFEENAAA